MIRALMVFLACYLLGYVGYQAGWLERPLALLLALVGIVAFVRAFTPRG